ncbi:hypothetical protein XENORESO_002903 [Xenotaenia resolanae]|uniref:Secreted protein n=1 Tax=Xenotaenia resolanae TaxID=208358 RepID=A0ABV0W6C0_9TELE
MCGGRAVVHLLTQTVQAALIAAVRSSALLVLVSLIFLWTILQRFSGVSQVLVSPVCWPIKHSKTKVTGPALGTFGNVGRYRVLLENELHISIQLVSRRKHEVL